MSLHYQSWEKAKKIGLLGTAGIYLAGIGTAVYAGCSPGQISATVTIVAVCDLIIGELFTFGEVRTLTQMPLTLVSYALMDELDRAFEKKEQNTQKTPTQNNPQPPQDNSTNTTLQQPTFDPWCELKEPEQKPIDPWCKLESIVQ